MKLKITNRGLYWGLIITFGLLYACVGFVSTLHSITFFQLANNLGLAILLGLTYEVGQASVLFSILMSKKNQGKFLPWALMILLTALQVTANVYASFKFMSSSGSTDWTYWQKSILFGVQASSPEMYQVIISWIAGALLPIVALGMTALVAQNMTFMKEENDDNESSKAGERESEKIYDETTAPYRGPSQKPNDQVDDLKKEEYVATEIPDRENQLESLKNALFNNTFHEASYKEENSPKDKESGMTIIEKPVQINIQSEEDANKEFAELIEREEQEEKTAAASIIPSEKEIEEIIENEVQKRMAEIPMESIVQKYNDLQKNINSYKAESEMNPRTEMSEIIDDGGISDELDEEIERLSTIIYPNKMEEYIHTSPILQPDASDFKDFSDYVNDQIMNDLKEGKHLSKEAERLTEKVSQPIGKYDMKFGPEFTKMMAEINEEESKKEVIVEPPKKRGRPPKQKDKVAETKKEREPLPKEEVKVPQKPKRRVNPLKRKAKKIKPLKSLKEINKPSKGDEVIALLEKMEREEKKESITPLAKNEQESQESLLVPPELKDNFASYVVNGVEVIDAKAVPVKKNLN